MPKTTCTPVPCETLPLFFESNVRFCMLQSVCLHMHWLTLWPNVQLEFNWKCIRNHVWVRKADRQTTRITAVCKYDTLHARWTCECSISAISKWHAREVCIFVLYFLMEKLLDERWTHTPNIIHINYTIHYMHQISNITKQAHFHRSDLVVFTNLLIIMYTDFLFNLHGTKTNFQMNR